MFRIMYSILDFILRIIPTPVLAFLIVAGCVLFWLAGESIGLFLKLCFWIALIYLVLLPIVIAICPLWLEIVIIIVIIVAIFWANCM